MFAWDFISPKPPVCCQSLIQRQHACFAGDERALNTFWLPTHTEWSRKKRTRARRHMQAKFNANLMDISRCITINLEIVHVESVNRAYASWKHFKFRKFFHISQIGFDAYVRELLWTIQNPVIFYKLQRKHSSYDAQHRIAWHSSVL